MKRVMGGKAPASGCTASCSSGSVSISDCNGTCTAKDDEGVKCVGETAVLKKCCGGGENCTP